MIKVSHISKSYNEVTALKDVSFEVAKGELYGLIGPDGAGKSTLFKILTTLLLPDSGTAILNNFDVVKDYKNIRQIIGYMPESFSLYTDLTVEENLKFFATVFNTSIEENYYLIKDIYKMLEPFKDRKAGDLSGGMKQKLALSCALIHKPQILLLDEPTTGVDPVSRKEFWDILKKLQAEGLTTLVSTPFLDEAEHCDRIALLQNGQLLSTNTPEQLKAQYPYKLYEIKSKDLYHTLLILEKFELKKSAFMFGNSIHLACEHHITADTIKDYLQKNQVENISIKEIKPSIEDVFMYLMQD